MILRIRIFEWMRLVLGVQPLRIYIKTNFIMFREIPSLIFYNIYQHIPLSHGYTFQSFLQSCQISRSCAF
nr:MAG TPA: hypothetical protein [Caudoviricetes sp.]